MIAITKENQSTLNKAIQWLTKQNAYNDQRDVIDSNDGEDTVEWRRINKKCEDSFDKYLTYCSVLPKNQVKLIEKSDLY